MLPLTAFVCETHAVLAHALPPWSCKFADCVTCQTESILQKPVTANVWERHSLPNWNSTRQRSAITLSGVLTALLIILAVAAMPHDVSAVCPRCIGSLSNRDGV